MKLLKYLFVASFVISSCAGSTNSQENKPSSSSSPSDTSSSSSQSSNSGGGSSSGGGGGSSGGSSGGGSGSGGSSGGGGGSTGTGGGLPTINRPDIAQEDAHFASDEYQRLKVVTYANNVLTTPLFNLNYDDSQIPSSQRQSHQTKEDFLKLMYNQFLENATFGNEIFTLSTVTFKQLNDRSGEHGEYLFKNNELTMNFYYDPNSIRWMVSTFIHEYYHHLSTHKVEETISKFVLNPNRNNIDDYYWKEYMDAFNDGEERVLENVRDIGPNPISNLFLRVITYNHEVDQYYDNYYSLANSGRQIIFNRPRKNSNPIHAFLGYRLSNPEIFARWSTMVTNGYFPKQNGLPYIEEGSIVEDYVKSLFIRANPYYSYTIDKRIYPNNITYSGGNWNIAPEDLLKWSDVNKWSPASAEVVNRRYQSWKDFFENTLYNHNQLLSGVIRDGQNNLYFQVNKDNQVLSLEKVRGGTRQNIEAVDHEQVGQLTFNLRPHDAASQQKTKLPDSYLHKLTTSSLAQGDYYLKVNNQYLTQGLKLELVKNNIKTIFGFDSATSIPGTDRFKPYYQFLKYNNRIILRVLDI